MHAEHFAAMPHEDARDRSQSLPNKYTVPAGVLECVCVRARACLCVCTGLTCVWRWFKTWAKSFFRTMSHERVKRLSLKVAA